MQIGFSSVEITPPLGVELGGYGFYPERRAQKVLDPLYARAVCFSSGGKAAVIVNCDLVGLDAVTVKNTRQLIHSECGTEISDILLLSIHTHTGPAMPSLTGCGEADPEYMRTLPGLLAKAAKAATENQREVRQAEYFTAPIQPVGFNRARKGGPADNKVKGILFTFERGRPLALISHGCHPVTLGPAREISADFPGRAVQYLYKAGFDGVFLTGFCGDLDPVSNAACWGSGTEETIDEYGKRLAEDFIKNIEQGSVMKDLSLSTCEITMKLKLQRLTAEDIAAWLAGAVSRRSQEPGYYKAVEAWAEKTNEMLRLREDPYTETLTVQVITIGNYRIAGFPAEVFCSLGSDIEKAFPEGNIMLLGNANAVSRYIPDSYDIAHNGYAASKSCVVYQTLPLVHGEGERMATLVKEKLYTME